MKKLFVWGLMLCSMSTLAFGWGLNSEIINANHSASRGEGYPFLIDPIVQGEGRPVRIYLQRLRAYTSEDKQSFMQSQEAGDIDTHLQEVGVLEPLNSPKFFAELKQAYNSWFSLIRNEFDEFSHHWSQFKDIAPIVKRGITIQLTQDPSQADLIVVRADDMSVSKRACENNFREDACLLQVPDNDEQLHLVITDKPEAKTNRDWLFKYATGISLGLAPQIVPTKNQQGVQAEHAQYSLEFFRQSLMGGHREFTCDDLDGIVNLIDVTLYAGKKDPKVFRWFPYGWNSFCLDGTHYMSGIPVDNLNGTPTGKGPYTFFELSSKPGEERYMLAIVYDRKKQAIYLEPSRTETYTPFQKHKFYIDERDDKNRPVHSVSKDGLHKFHMYHHGLITRVVIRGNELLMIENQVTAPRNSSSNKQYIWERVFEYVEGGKIKILSLVIDPDTYERKVVYVDDVEARTGDEYQKTATLTVRISSEGKYEVVNETPLPDDNVAQAQPFGPNDGYNQRMNITLAVEKKVRSMSWEELRDQMLKFAGVE